MSVDLSRFEPIESGWFSTHGSFEGTGRAEFLNPKGCAAGPTVFTFDESGQCKAEMTIDSILVGGGVEENVHRFLFGRGSQPEDGVIEYGLGAPLNQCMSLTLETAAGTLSAGKQLGYGVNLRLGGEDERPILKFTLFNSAFKAVGGSPPRYWVLPLLNFVSDFHFGHPTLDRHPLRIYPTPSVSPELRGDDALAAQFTAQMRNRLIVFGYNGGPGFIERLADYDERADKLQSGRERALVTAVMVGNLGSDTLRPSDMRVWRPLGFLTLLGLASGTRVGAPWVELRGGGGELVERLHVRSGNPSFSLGRVSIREGFHDNGVGQLLTASCSSAGWKEDFVRVAAKRLIRGGSYELSVEEGLSHLLTSMDILCEGFELKSVLKPTELFPTETSKAVEDALRTAAASIENLAQQAKEQGLDQNAAHLRKISDQAAKAKNIHPGFGKAVLELLARFALPDARIMERSYALAARPDKRSWAEMLSSYRGISLHHGYFEFANARHDIQDVLAVIEHSHDILVRILLRILGYKGRYKPTMEKAPVAAEVDWVTDATTAQQLGYAPPGSGRA